MGCFVAPPLSNTYSVSTSLPCSLSRGLVLEHYTLKGKHDRGARSFLSRLAVVNAGSSLSQE